MAAIGSTTEPEGPRRLAATPAAGRIARATALLERSEPALRRVARRYAPRHEDAEDAFARAVETLLVKGPDLPPAQLLAWMRVVIRNEALSGVRRDTRRREVTGAGADPLDPELFPSPARTPQEELERRERVAAYAERLSRLKPQERRALALLGAGCSYAEIQAITGWTHTKVNRCVAEGRAALREQVAA